MLTALVDSMSVEQVETRTRVVEGMQTVQRTRHLPVRHLVGMGTSLPRDSMRHRLLRRRQLMEVKGIRRCSATPTRSCSTALVLGKNRLTTRYLELTNLDSHLRTNISSISKSRRRVYLPLYHSNYLKLLLSSLARTCPCSLLHVANENEDENVMGICASYRS